MPAAAKSIRPLVTEANWTVPSVAYDPALPAFLPDHPLAAWVQATFIEEDAALANEDHAHLRYARMGFLWARVAAKQKGKRILGQAEIIQPRGSTWAKARQQMQIAQWFGDANGELPDFLITLDAAWCAEVLPEHPAAFCALIEHELYHCGQATDAFGMPRFNQQTGQPVFTIRAHDVEEFVGVVARYGAAAAGSEVEALVRAANRGPTMAPAQVDAVLAGVCGTCSARVRAA